MTPARSRQEVVELIGLIGRSGDELERIAVALDLAIADAKAEAEAAAQPIKAAMAEAQEKVEAWFRVHPEAATSIPGAERFLGDPMEAQLAAVMLSSARPLTQRQITVLEALKDGHVLRRQHKHRSYSLIEPSRPSMAKKYLNSNHVFDLQHRFLDAYDPKSGDRLLGVSAFDPRAVEFRIKPDVVVP
ncbi:hypothetical protein BH10PSE5_BH10PSE5_01500 [soil metagenome]